MKTLITYKSKYGSSKQYAQWLGEELNCDAKDLSEIKKTDMAEYDLIIHGGGLYAGRLAGLGFYKKNIKYLQENNKKLVTFATGASPYGKKVIYEVLQHNFKGLMKDVQFFYCEGNYDYSIMTPLHKTMMKMMNKMLTKKIKDAEKQGHKPDPIDVEFQGLLFSHFERADKKWCNQIVEYVKGLEK